MLSKFKNMIPGSFFMIRFIYRFVHVTAENKNNYSLTENDKNRGSHYYKLLKIIFGFSFLLEKTE